jgi:hypothetical protein
MLKNSSTKQDTQERLEYILKFNRAFDYAFSHFTELHNYYVNLVIRKTKVKLVMNTVPSYKGLLFNNKQSRSYFVFVNENNDNKLFLNNLSEYEARGWFAHELGHIAVDYIHLSSVDFIDFGFNYFLNKHFRRKSELDASFFAIHKGLGHELVAAANGFEQTKYFCKSRKKSHFLYYIPSFGEAKDYLRKGAEAFKTYKA